MTVPDTYPLPNMMDFTSCLAGCSFFSKIDLRKGYHQIPVNPQDIPKTAIITPFGLFEYLRMPFGLRNAGSSFQRMMDRVLAGLDFCFWYLDDVVVASVSYEQHLQHLHLLFQWLQEHGLVINLEKCVFAARKIEFVGHELSAAGVRPLYNHVEALQAYPRPSTVKQLQAFLGLVNFYRRFVPAAARLLKPLTKALVGGARAVAPVVWTDSMQSAFLGAKSAVAAATCLAHPVVGERLGLIVDASATHVGAALQQKPSPSSPWQPLGFFSKKLDTAQMKYSAFDREMFACYVGIRHFRYILEGQTYNIHRPQAAHLCFWKDVQPLDGAAVQTIFLHFGIHQRYLACGRCGQPCG